MMNRSNATTARFAAGTAVYLALVLASEPASAQDDPPPAEAGDEKKDEKTDEKKDEDAASEPAEAEAEKPAEAEPQKAAEAAAASGERDEAGTPVERWPGSAYPEPKIRGIYGGSLWATMHGLQWPYAPQISDDPDTRLGLSGSVWVDTGFKKVETTDPNQFTRTRLIQQGRMALRVTPTYTVGELFAQGQGEFIANGDQAANFPQVVLVDDLWVRVGQWNRWDIQAGRYEGWELYHLGMGLDQNTVEREGAELTNSNPPDFYGVTFMFYRPQSAGNIAIHAYPTDFLRFELLGQVGNETGGNTLGVRPAGILDLGVLKLKGGFEFRKQTPTDDTTQQESEVKGGGGAVQVILDPHVEFGVNGAYGITDLIDSAGNIDEGQSITVWSAGGFANGRVIENLLVGAGANFTNVEDIHEDANGQVGQFDHLQVFGAVQYLLFQRMFIKGVFAYAKANFDQSFTENPPFENTMLSARLRLMYAF